MKAVLEILPRVVKRFAALADESRLRMLMRLREGECNVTALAKELKIGQASVSKHLSVLRDAGLVDVRREGTSAFYFASDPGVFEMCSIVCDGVFKQMRGEHQILQKATRQLKKESR